MNLKISMTRKIYTILVCGIIAIQSTAAFAGGPSFPTRGVKCAEGYIVGITAPYSSPGGASNEFGVWINESPEWEQGSQFWVSHSTADAINIDKTTHAAGRVLYAQAVNALNSRLKVFLSTQGPSCSSAGFETIEYWIE